MDNGYGAVVLGLTANTSLKIISILHIIFNYSFARVTGLKT